MPRHVGKIVNTDQRCVVVFMQIPNRETHALVIPMDSVPPRLEQAIMEILESTEGQQEETFANVLNRRLMPDTGKNVLMSLHESGHLMPVLVEQVVMLPQPNMPFPLAHILQQMGRLKANETMQAEAMMDKFNPHLANINADNVAENQAIARNLMAQADIMELDVKRKREEAYRYDPSLKPKEVKIVSEFKETKTVEAVVQKTPKTRGRKKSAN